MKTIPNWPRMRQWALPGLLAGLMGFALLSPSYAGEDFRLSQDYLLGTATTAAVDRELVETLYAEDTATMLVYLRERADLSPAFGMSWKERGRFVYRQLTEVAERSQADLRGWLSGRGSEYRAFWIDNVIVVEQGGLMLLDSLRARPEIEAVRAEMEIHLVEPLEVQPANQLDLLPVANISHVDADQVWEMGITGKGITVANIDTGVRVTHNALANQYRGCRADGDFQHDYHWWNPYAPTAAFDWHGHGTHTMGTMLGDDFGVIRTGMAPAARWMACAGFHTNGQATTPGLLECGQFMVAPTDLSGDSPDPDQRPHVVNNSWGNCETSYNPWYEGVVDAWIAAGIVPVFSNGNAVNCGYSEPPGLNTVGNPARSGKVLGIGSTDAVGTPPEAPPVYTGGYSAHSNWGPTDNPSPGLPNYPDHFGFPNIKPNVSAPGRWVLSPYVLEDQDNRYAWSTGTSMAGPHVAGLVALMWEAAPCLVGDYATTGTIIMETARPIDYDSGGSPPPGPDNVPNYATGWGEIDALDAVLAAMDHCGISPDSARAASAATNWAGSGDQHFGAETEPSGGAGNSGQFFHCNGPFGRMRGQVTSAVSGQPIAGVTVTLVNPAGSPSAFTRTTDEDGHYVFRLLPVLEQPDGSYSLVFTSDLGYGDAIVTGLELADQASLAVDVELDAGLLAVPGPLELTVVEGGTLDAPLLLENIGTLATDVSLSLTHGLRENFEGGFPPPGWNVIDNGDCPWARNDQIDAVSFPVAGHGGRPNLAGGAGFAAGADADACGAAMDTTLISPPLDWAGDMAAAVSALVGFTVAYHPDGAGGRFDVDISPDGGDTWHALLSQTGNLHPFGPGAEQAFDASGYLGGGDVRLRFRFQGSQIGWAQIDTLRATVEGGLNWAQLASTAATIGAGGGMNTQLLIDSASLPGPGYYELTLYVEHDSPEQASPVSVPVRVRVLGPDTPVLAVQPGALAFGEVPLGVNSSTRTLTLNSAGTGPVTIAAITAPDAPFSQNGGSCPAVPFELAPGASCTVGFEFAPDAEGLFEARITITADAEPGEFEVMLSGQGVDTAPPGDEVFKDRFEE